MTIDSHQHFWTFDPVTDSWITPEMGVIQRDFLPEDLIPVLETNGVDGCVAVQADQSNSETEFLLQLAEANEVIKGVVGWIDLKSPDLYDKLEVYSQFELLKGFRHVVQVEADGFLLQTDFVNGVGQLAAFDYTYDILIYPHQLKEAYEFAKKLPNVRFVLDHLAKPYIKKGEIESWKNDLKSLSQLLNVSCKISGMITEADWHKWKNADLTPYLDVAFEAFGTKRLLFGSDWPVCLVAGEYGAMKAVVTDYLNTFSINERKDVMGENAVRFYNLD
jgi:L-fuconolactonase